MDGDWCGQRLAVGALLQNATKRPLVSCRRGERSARGGGELLQLSPMQSGRQAGLLGFVRVVRSRHSATKRLSCRPLLRRELLSAELSGVLLRGGGGGGGPPPGLLLLPPSS